MNAESGQANRWTQQAEAEAYEQQGQSAYQLGRPVAAVQPDPLAQLKELGEHFGMMVWVGWSDPSDSWPWCLVSDLSTGPPVRNGRGPTVGRS